MLEERFSSTSAYAVDLDELLLHIDYNPVLKKIPNIKERFWEMFIVDIFINNNDRNNGNWGALYEDGIYRLAPVFDNGAAFSTKLTDRKLTKFLGNEERALTSILNGTTVYETGGKNIRAKDILIMENEGLLKVAYKVVSVIENKMYDIKRFIQSIPETKDSITVCSEVRKQFYIKTMELKLKHF